MGTFCPGTFCPGTFCPGTFCPDKTSPLGYIGKRGRFVRTKCPRLAIWASGDVLSEQNVP